MIRRVVLVKTRTPERVDSVLDAFERLRGQVPGLVGITTAADNGGRCLGYDRMFTLTFQDREAVDRWRGHPAHVPIRAELEACAELLVFEHEITQPDRW
ncbi:Dabb family protein [Streptomyces sp. NPDC050528]|uniref:Dabb family protein n=1 Tax=unclassified Streptomyces TaxID=2593676 RepID=UPI0037B3EACD